MEVSDDSEFFFITHIVQVLTSVGPPVVPVYIFFTNLRIGIPLQKI